MYARLATVALCLAGVTSHAKAANDSMTGLESCIQTARLADTICSRIADDPAPRAACFAKARAAQLECLDRVLSEAPAATAPPGSMSATTRPASPIESAPPEASARRPASDESTRTDLHGGTAGGAAAADSAAKLSNAVPEPAPASLPAPAAEPPTGAIRSNGSGPSNDKPAGDADWLISETTSPVDYSPLVTAAIRSSSDAKVGSTTLAVRCRAQHTDVSIRATAPWGVPSGNELLIDHQINDRPIVRQPWILSTDGRTATYKNDAIELLGSIPDGATLKVAVADKGNVRRGATFLLTGLSAIRQKVGTACRWPSQTAKTSSEKP